MKLDYIKGVVWGVLGNGLGIMIGGDMNAHIWELDGCENENCRRMKENMNGATDLELCLAWVE